MNQDQLSGLKVVTAEEMARIEKKAIAEGVSHGLSEADFMHRAGEHIAYVTAAYIAKYDLKQRVAMLVGKGNNGGDAFVAGRILLEMGFSVEAYHYFPLDTCSSLCVQQYHAFQQKGGIIRFVKGDREIAFGKEGVLLDGLVGTGFKGKAEGELANAINSANRSRLPILSIDIPSGLNGTTGEVGSVAICASQTIYLGHPKIGFFLNEGWNHVGELVQADFGLPEQYSEEAKAEAYLINTPYLAKQMPAIKRNRHKYEAGYVLALAGSWGMEGSAQLSTTACLCAGAGIVRLFHPPGMEAVMSQGAMEVIKEALLSTDNTRFLLEAKRASAALIGPGIGRTKEVKQRLKKLLPKLSLPCVLDADVLYFLSLYPRWKLPPECVLTPHKREMERLLIAEGLPTHNLHASCQQYADKKGVTLVLKGAPTFIFHPQTSALIMTAGDPGMATAGSGDVLTGMIAALLAQKVQPRVAATLATLLHGIAGEYAAEDKTSYCLVASDLIDYLPDAFHTVLHALLREEHE